MAEGVQCFPLPRLILRPYERYTLQAVRTYHLCLGLACAQYGSGCAVLPPARLVLPPLVAFHGRHTLLAHAVFVLR